MFSTKFIAAAAASFSLISSSTAVYDASSQRNLAMYWVWTMSRNGWSVLMLNRVLVPTKRI